MDGRVEKKKRICRKFSNVERQCLCKRLNPVLNKYKVKLLGVNKYRDKKTCVFSRYVEKEPSYTP